MEASTAGVLSFKSISNDILGHISLLYTNLNYEFFFYGFSRVTPFGVCGGPEKDRNVCFCGGISRTLSPDSSCQLNILLHDGNSPGVDGTQVGIIKQPDKVCLRCFLETQYRR